jgi:selenide,water dikinase
VVLNERPDALDYLLADAVTSGGLLFSVPVADSGRVESEFAARGLNLWRIGSVYAGSAQIRIE